MQLWQFIQNKILAAQDVVLLYVLHSYGSSPGRQGFKMAIATDHSFNGSIGGGIMEHKFVELAKAVLAQDTAEPGVYRQVHDKEAGKHKSGMICSGEQTIFLYKIRTEDIPQIAALVASLQHNKRGSLRLSNEGILFSEDVAPAHFLFEQKSEHDFLFIENTGYKNHLHIIGGGHCALALSRLMRDMDFFITVYDDRDLLNTIDQNTYAHEKHILTTYTELKDLIMDAPHTFVAIMTFGYRSDYVALKALLGKEFEYVGLLGSKKKIEKMLDEYRNENLPTSFVSKLYAPIGIPIKSRTPAEIAISIAAQIIAVKNKN